MNLLIVFRRAARTEFDEVADWYERRRAGLGLAFTAAAERILDHIATESGFYPQVYHEVREALVRGYPYCVHYREEAGRVLVLSVFHKSRDPATWQRRP